MDTVMPKLKVIAKYGIGLDSIDVAHATEKGLPVLFTPGVNHTTVADFHNAKQFSVSADQTGVCTQVKSIQQ